MPDAFPGLPAGRGIHPVNHLGGLGEDFLVPPQRGTYSLVASVISNGPQTVMIETVRLAEAGTSSWPLTLTAPVRYSRPGWDGSSQLPPPASRVLRDVRLAPGQQIFLGFPVRSAPCGRTGGWTEVPSFYVTEHFLFFTHTVALPWGMHGNSLVMRSPGPPGDPHTVCAGQQSGSRR